MLKGSWPPRAPAIWRHRLETLVVDDYGKFGKMENGLMIRTVVVVGTLLLGVGAVMAQQDVVKQTQTVMKANGKNAGALAAMVKGEKPYDQATVDAALKQFEDTAKKLPTLFPESTKGLKPDGDYSASSKIWEDKAGFDEHIASFAKVVSRSQGPDQGSRHAEGDISRGRQAVRRLPRDLSCEERLEKVLT